MIQLRRAAPVALCLVAASIVTAAAAPATRQRLQELNLRETSLNADQGRNLNRISRLLSVLVQMKRDPPPALLVDPRDAQNAVRAAILVRAMTPELQKRAEAYAVEAGEIARQRRLAAVASETLFKADSEKADHLLDAVGANAPAEQQDEGPVIPPERLLSPVEGEVVHGFGAAAAGGGKSAGLTLRTRPNARVQNPDSAVVQYVGPVKGWGVIVILRLTGGYNLVLAGLDRAIVSVGQPLAAGAPVGWMPEGQAAASELYFELRERGEPVDPGRWMGTNTAQGSPGA